MDALIVIDVQNDFCPDGKLAVPAGNEIIAPINFLASKFEHIVLTQDWHPASHLSFASNHANKSPYESVELKYGNQVLWPDHCIQDSLGAEFHPGLDTEKAGLIIRKGYRKEIDSYSAFTENDQETVTGLHGYLSSINVQRLFLTGLATDFCVKWSALDAIKYGFETYVISDAIRGINIENSVELAISEMKDAGVQFISSLDIDLKRQHA